jgi:tetratricopeptide (TPR) repeat protein
VFSRKKAYEKITYVIESEESRLRMMGSKIVKRKRTKDEQVAYVYTIEYQDHPYHGKTYFHIHDGRGYAVRFNATKHTYSVNLPKFERFIKSFSLSNERSEDPDMELIEVDDMTMSIVGGAFTAEDVEGLDAKSYRYRDRSDGSDLLNTEAELKDAILQLQAIADSWPPRIDTPEEREAAEDLWNVVEQSLLKMRTSDPDDYYFALWLGDCYRMGHNLDVDGALEKAVSHLRAASLLKPKAFLPHSILGDHYTFSGRPEEGEQEYLEAIRLSDKPLPRAYYGLANAYYLKNDFGGAVEYADKYLEHDPDNKSMMFIRERAAAALEGKFEPKTIEIITDEKPDGKIRSGVEDDEDNE